jgi:hypothetical protein
LGNHFGIDERQIGLHVYDYLAAQVARCFGDAIGAGAVTGLRQPDDAAERFHRVGNPLVVGRNDNGIDTTGVGGAPVDVLNHWSADDVSENFSRETRRIVAGGNDGDGVLL